MLTFLFSRLLQAIAALAVLTAATFWLSHASGDPRYLLISPTEPYEDFVRLGQELGLDKPLPVQFGIYVDRLLHGDLGNSLVSHEPVSSMLAARVPASAELALVALIMSLVVGVPLGVISALQRGRLADHLAHIVALLGQSTPSFWLGILLIEVFAVNLGWLPSGTNQTASSIILPAITLALFGIAGVSRLLRSSLLEVLDSEFIKLTRSKGLPERLVIWKHALKNAMLPVVTLMGVFVVGLITGTVVVEVVFAWPGVGLLTFSAILNRDFPVIQGVVLLAGAVTIGGALVADLIYLYLDPRIRLAGR